MATSREDAQNAIFDRIAELAPRASPESIRDLAEAYAYAVSPSESHG
jgi:hypothetical protein